MANMRIQKSDGKKQSKVRDRAIKQARTLKHQTQGR